MANKKTNTAVTESRKAMEDTKNITTIECLINGQPREVKVKYSLSLGDVVAMVDEVYDSAFAEDTEEYVPEIASLIKKACVINYYTDIDFPEEAEEGYAFIIGTDIRTILTYVNANQWADIESAITNKINHKLRMQESAAAMQFNQLVNQLVNKIDDFTSANQQLFGDVNPEQMTRLVESLSHIDNIDEKKIAEAVLDAQEKQKK